MLYLLICLSEEENSQTIEGTSNPKEAPFYGMIEEVYVMLIDHDREFATEMIDLTKLCVNTCHAPGGYPRRGRHSKTIS